MTVDEKDRQFLISNIEKAQELIEVDDINGLFKEIDRFIAVEGYAPPDYLELNDIGRKAERIYDRIYYNN